MIIFIKNKVYTQSNMLSCIVGQHGKAPWDFEFSVPVNYGNSFLENCLYTDILITGVDNSSRSAPKQDFVITKIEQNIEEGKNTYTVSGIGKAEYILQTSIALNDLVYAEGETGLDFVNRVLRTFTHKTWITSQLGGGAKMNFPKIEKGQYLSKWFWDAFKKEKAICTVKALSQPDTFNLEIVGSEGVDLKIISKFISKTRLWEKQHDMFWAKANNFLFKYQKTPNASNPMPDVITGAYSTKGVIPTTSFTVDSLEDALNRIITLEDASGKDLGLKVQGVPADLDFRFSQYFPVFVQTKMLNHTPGVRIRLKQNSTELLELLLGLHLRTRPANYDNTYPDLGTGVKVDNAVWFSQWRSSDASGPVVPERAKVYGIMVDGSVGKLSRYQSGAWTPSSLAFTLNQSIADLAAAGTMKYPELPDGNPRTDYEVIQSEYDNVDVGDEIVVLGGGEAILTDKVISYENGETHYDCTTKDLLEVDAKQ